MSSTPQTPTIETTAAEPQPTVGMGASIARPANVTSSRAVSLRAELEGILSRLQDVGQRRAAILDLLLRQRRIVGGVWVDLQRETPAVLVSRLPGPALDRTSLREWISGIAQGLNHSGEAREVPSSEIRNLSGLAMVLRQDQAAEAVILLGTSSANKPLQDEWLTLHELAIVWEGAALRSRVRESEERTRLAAALLDLAGRMQARDSVRGACLELVNSLHKHLGCGLTAVGLNDPGERTTRLVATSDGGVPDPHGIQSQRIEAAMDECTVGEVPIQHPGSERAGGPPSLAHKRLAAMLGAESAVSAPLRSEHGDVIGAVLCAGEAAKVLAPTCQQFLCAMGRPVGQSLVAVRRHEGGRLLRLGRIVAKAVSVTRVAVVAVLTAVIAGVLMIPYPYRISAGGALEPLERRLSPAPFDGLLESTFATPGDVVTTGQLLATMDGRELEWELAGVVADQQRAIKERDAHLAGHEVTQALMAALEVERLAAREALLRERLTRLEVRSPIDGIVLSGSLDRRENVPVTVGQALYEIAPLAQLRLDVEVPADDISHVREGMPVELRLHGMAGEVRVGTIERVRPASEIREGRNVFVAEVSLDNQSGELRPGMKGSVRVTGDAHPLGWNLFHRPWDYLRSRMF